MEEVDCTQEGKAKKSQKELSKDELNRKVYILSYYLLVLLCKTQCCWPTGKFPWSGLWLLTKDHGCLRIYSIHARVASSIASILYAHTPLRTAVIWKKHFHC